MVDLVMTEVERAVPRIQIFDSFFYLFLDLCKCVWPFTAYQALKSDSQLPKVVFI